MSRAPFRDRLEHVLGGAHLDSQAAYELIGAVMDGELSPAQTGAMLAALRAKGCCADELVGAARAMRERALPLDTSGDQLVDTCGTGGDGSGSFNISTAAAIVAANVRDDGALIVIAASSAWANRLRFETEALLEAARSVGVNAHTCRIRVSQS